MIIRHPVTLYIQAEGLRSELERAVSSAGRVDEDRRRLESELGKTEASTMEVKEERNRLQKRYVR